MEWVGPRWHLPPGRPSTVYHSTVCTGAVPWLTPAGQHHLSDFSGEPGCGCGPEVVVWVVWSEPSQSTHPPAAAPISASAPGRSGPSILPFFSPSPSTRLPIARTRPPFPPSPASTLSQQHHQSASPPLPARISFHPSSVRRCLPRAALIPFPALPCFLSRHLARRARPQGVPDQPATSCAIGGKFHPRASLTAPPPPPRPAHALNLDTTPSPLSSPAGPGPRSISTPVPVPVPVSVTLPLPLPLPLAVRHVHVSRAPCCRPPARQRRDPSQ